MPSPLSLVASLAFVVSIDGDGLPLLQLNRSSSSFDEVGAAVDDLGAVLMAFVSALCLVQWINHRRCCATLLLELS